MVQAQAHEEDSTVLNMIRECHEVSHWASSCAVRCIETPEEGMDECARMCLDADDVAQTLASLAARGSPSAAWMADCTQRVVADCARMCEKMAPRASDGRRTMETCAQACRTAAESIGSYIAATR